MFSGNVPDKTELTGPPGIIIHILHRCIHSFTTDIYDTETNLTYIVRNFYRWSAVIEHTIVVVNQTHISRTHQTDIFFGHHAQSSCCSIFSRFFIHKRIVEINSQTGRCSRHRCSQRFCQQIIVMCVVIQTQIQFCISRLSFFQHVKSFIELGRHR